MPAPTPAETTGRLVGSSSHEPHFTPRSIEVLPAAAKLLMRPLRASPSDEWNMTCRFVSPTVGHTGSSVGLALVVTGFLLVRLRH